MMVKPILFISILFALFHSACFSQQLQKALKNYIATKDTAYKWRAEDVLTNDHGTFYEVALISQKWKEIYWTHRLIIYFPKKAKCSNTLALVLFYGEIEYEPDGNKFLLSTQTYHYSSK